MKILFWVKRFFQVLLVLGLIWGLWNHRLLNYAVSQAKGQLKILYHAEKIDDLLQAPEFPDSLKPKLQLIAEVKQYAEDSLGITKSENYTTFYDQKGRTLMWMLMASEPYEMKAKLWNFPFLGDFSYKGFFEKKKARLEQYELQLQGYDTELGKAGGWSTLGWFKDPVLSSMLNYSKGELAALIIHELTHGTLYVKNDVDFNENLASFVGENGAKKFLLHKFGPKSEEYLNYRSLLNDERMFEKYLVNCSKELKTLYQGFSTAMPDTSKYLAKKKLIYRFVVDVHKLPLERKRKYVKRMRGAFLSGNAFFMSYQRYDAQKDSLESVLISQYGGDIKLYLKDLKSKYSSL